MKTSLACFALFIAVTALIALDAQYPHVLSPQTYGLLLLAWAITLLIQVSRWKWPAKSRHPQSG